MNRIIFTLFADDSTLTYSFNPRSESQSANKIINHELSKIYNWLLVNNIKINIEKTNYVLFNYSQKVDFPEIRIGNGVISRVGEATFLGVVFDENFKFDSHICCLTKKISKTVGLLSKLRHFLPIEILQRIYDSLVNPYLVYCIEVWGFTSMCYLDKIVKVQKAAIRLVNNLPFISHTSPHFKSCNILKLCDLFKYRVLILMHRAVFNNESIYLFHNLLSHISVHSYPTRNCTKLVVPPFSRSKSRMSISFVSDQLWNDLSDEIVNCSSLSIFKKKT